MLRRITVAALFAGALALPVVAVAGPGGKWTFHEHDVFTFEETNFCGTGATVLGSVDLNAKVWVGETGGDPEQDLKVAFNVITTYTNPTNGATLLEHGAGGGTNEIIVGLESGPHTHLFVENGLRAQLKLPHGGVLTRDAGSITYTVSFDAEDNFLGLEVISVHGPHPAFDSDVFCDVATEALGL